jgi:CHAT domain
MADESPVVLLAFANARGDLRALREEQSSLQRLFEPLDRSGHCQLVFRPDITLKQLFEALQENRERLVLFHYGGHADADRLMFDSQTGESPAFAGGLATLLGQCRSLKVVFLNGCSTGPQVKALLDARVPAVIATARPIGDVVARDLAVAFYQALTIGAKERDIDQGQNLLGAFEAAKGFVTTATGANRSALLRAGRDLVGEDISDLTGMPWDLYPSEPPVSVARWTLFDKDPYFGLPGIPEDIPLPPKPFVYLEHFQRKHAPVFFGRGKAIRVLYDLIRNPTSPKVILYFGPTGVGKSSVLDAGLLPRLERTHEVVYCRRDESHGLLGTLRIALGEDGKRSLVEAWREREASVGRPLVVVVDQAEEAFTRPVAIAPERNEEDALERPWTDPDAELRGFAVALRELFGGAARP